MITFVWDNFGPGHLDRCRAVAHRWPQTKVFGVELYGSSYEYDWHAGAVNGFSKKTLFPNNKHGQIESLRVAFALLRACLESGSTTFFLCHYERREIFFVALLLRILGKSVFVMNDSKFDDYPRYLWREVVKFAFYLPYHGALSSGERAKDYIRFLGIDQSKIFTSYNSLDLARLRSQATDEAGDVSFDFVSRFFIVVARLLPKKNISMALKAYSIYLRNSSSVQKRHLHIVGSGPLEPELRQSAIDLGVADMVVWHGFVQTKQVAKLLSASLALLLPSIEEQFGNVVIEAQALSIPCIVSTNVGARDHLIRTGVNGFVVEPDNPEGMAKFMLELACSQTLWEQMSRATQESADRGDVRQFCNAVKSLLDTRHTAFN